MSRKSPLVSIIVVTWNRKRDVLECLESVSQACYENKEVIVVDNNSTDGTFDAVACAFPAVMLIHCNEDLMASGGRNVGIERASGEFLFCLDGDNIVDKRIISELVVVMQRDESIGIVGPKMYFHKEPDRLWFAGASVNLVTSQTKYVGSNEIDGGQHDQLRDTGHFPNAFMIRRAVVDTIGKFDNVFGMFYEESDFCMRAQAAGFRTVFVPAAQTWHKIPLPSEFRAFERGVADDEERRTYLFARNRIIFMRRHAVWPGYLIFVSVFLPLLSMYYLLVYGRNLRIFKPYVIGVLDGLRKRQVRMNAT